MTASGKGIFTRCEVFRHTNGHLPHGIHIQECGAPVIAGCIIRENKFGVVVNDTSPGAASGVETSNIYRGNSGGDVMRY